MTGKKNDNGKLRYDLLPPDSLHLVADVYTKGGKKYGDRNWELGLAWERIFAAMIRHAYDWWAGEDNDPEDGQHHLASVVWCALTLMAYSLRGIGKDPRTWRHKTTREVLDERAKNPSMGPGGHES